MINTINYKPLATVNKDYRPFNNALFNIQLKQGSNSYQYSIEQRNGFLAIIELNFKPNTKTEMAIPVCVYNDFVEEIAKIIPYNGIKANDLMPIFINCMDRFRKSYGFNKPIKQSSYLRYSSVLYLLWKVTNGELGLIANLQEAKTERIISQTNKTVIIESELKSRGYYVKPTSSPIVKFVDLYQKPLSIWGN